MELSTNSGRYAIAELSRPQPRSRSTRLLLSLSYYCMELRFGIHGRNKWNGLRFSTWPPWEESWRSKVLPCLQRGSSQASWIKSIKTFIRFSAVIAQWHCHVAGIPDERLPTFFSELWEEFEREAPKENGRPVYWRMQLTLQVSATSTWVLYKL